MWSMFDRRENGKGCQFQQIAVCQSSGSAFFWIQLQCYLMGATRNVQVAESTTIKKRGRVLKSGRHAWPLTSRRFVLGLSSRRAGEISSQKRVLPSSNSHGQMVPRLPSTTTAMEDSTIYVSTSVSCSWLVNVSTCRRRHDVRHLKEPEDDVLGTDQISTQAQLSVFQR